MTLAEAQEGQWLLVTGAATPEVEIQTLRFGINSGAKIRLQKKIRGGPVIVSRNELEIAIGQEIAQAIEVRALYD